ncbi:MAG: response regulator [Spirochaetes bacterium]|nr:response regulator [Spirochaetota bacterium]
MESRLLLVDDNPDFLDSTKDVLEDADYKVMTASCGEDALALVREQSFDVVLMDIKMPGLNGLETFLRMKESKPGIKVILFTAFSISNVIQKALEEGVCEIMNKPLDIYRLLELIKNIRDNSEKVCILLVDDDMNLCDNLTDSLLVRGYRVTSTFNGVQAIKQAQTDFYDILLLDMRLPDKNGLELYREIKKLQPGLITIIITGYAEEFSEHINQALKENVYGCINKPVDMKNLLTMLKKIKPAQKMNKIIE